jgi:hypothetical protein
MNPLPVLVAHKNQFHAICQNLSLLGTSEHEGLTIFQNIHKQSCYPVTCKKSWLDFNDPDRKVIEVALTFFEKNLGRFAEELQSHVILTKLEPFVKQENDKIRFHTLRQELFNLQALKLTEADRAILIQQADQYEQQAKQRTVEREEEVKQRVQQLEKQLASLQENITACEDTLIVCQNTSLSLHIKKLGKVPYFTCQFNYKMEKTSLSESEKKHYKYKFDFSEYHSKTVTSLVEWIDDPAILNQIKDFNALFELYRLADFVNDAAFRSDCLKLMSLQLSADEKLHILTIAEYSSGDELIKNCGSFVASHFKSLRNHPKFLEIKPEYFLRIIKDCPFVIEHAEEGFFAILAWVESKAQRESKAAKDVLYEVIEGHQIIDYLPLDRLSKDTFISKVLPLKILSSEDTAHWLELYLQGKTPIVKVEDLKCKKIDDRKAKINWNIPLETFSNIGQWNNKKKVKRNFIFNNVSWQLELGKWDDHMTFGIRIATLTTDFEFFLEVGHITYFTQPDGQPERTNFRGKGIQNNPDSYIKGIDIKLSRLDQLDLNQGYVPLKILLYLSDSPPKTN